MTDVRFHEWQESEIKPPQQEADPAAWFLALCSVALGDMSAGLQPSWTQRAGTTFSRKATQWE